MIQLSKFICLDKSENATHYFIIFWHEWLPQISFYNKVQVGKDQEKAQSEKDSHSKKPRWEKTKLQL